MRSPLLVALLVVAVLGATGCSTRFQRYVGSFGAVGAGVGAAYGAPGVTGVSAGEGAAIGGVSGGLVGAVVADSFGDQDWDGMEAELARLRRENDDQALALASKDQLLGEHDEMMRAMQAELADANARNAQLASQVGSLQGELDASGVRLASLADDLAAREDMLRSKSGELDELRNQLGSRVAVAGGPGGGITLTILDELLFSSGRAELSPQGEGILSEIADQIRQAYPDRELIIEGHTDNQPIVRSKWRSNWELGAARSLAVLHYLKDRETIAPERLAAVSRADTMPAASNDSEQGRSQNRRAVIIIMPPTGFERVQHGTEAPAAPASVAYIQAE